MPVTKKQFTEADMYKPVKDFFAGLGYAVNAEVMGIDVCMQKDGVLTVIELKKSLNITLLCQAVDRQSVTSQVYVAVPRPKYPRSRENELARRIVKRLELGLIYVKLPDSAIEIIHFPPAVIKNPSKKRKDMVMKELNGRSADANTGGQSKRPVATAYRERAVHIACALERGGALTVRELRNEYGCGQDTSGILRKNYYGWYTKASGSGSGTRYVLSDKGVELLIHAEDGIFAEIIKPYREKAAE